MSLKLSKKFTRVLERISHNKIANELLSLPFIASKDSYLFNFNYNYISIGESNNLVTFTPSDKVEKIMSELPKVYSVSEIRNLTHSNSNDVIFKALGYDKTANPYWYPQPDCGCGENGDCGCDRAAKGLVLGETTSKYSGKTYVLFKCVDTDRLSVVNKSVLVKEDNSKVIYSTNRNSIKVGRLVNHLLSELVFEFVPKDIEDFVNLYKASYDFTSNKDIQFEVVKGDMIAHWYKRKNYVDGGGQLSNSCMCEKGSEYFDIYTKNSSVCSLVILYADNGKLKSDGTYHSDLIKGRAILWDVVHNGENIKFMDRVYTQNDSDVELFKSYAQSKGWWYKESQSMYPETKVTNGDIETKDRFEVELDVIDMVNFPYMDTMCHWIKRDDKIYLTNDHKLGHTRWMRCTNGTFVAYKAGREVGYYTGSDEFGEWENEVEEVSEESSEEVNEVIEDIIEEISGEDTVGEGDSDYIFSPGVREEIMNNRVNLHPDLNAEVIRSRRVRRNAAIDEVVRQASEVLNGPRWMQVDDDAYRDYLSMMADARSNRNGGE